MTTSCAALLLCFGLVAALPAKEAGWTGNYTDKKYLNGHAVIQLNILQAGETISVDFDAVYNDGHGCAPKGSGPAKVVDKNTLLFTFTDSANNAWHRHNLAHRGWRDPFA